MSDKSEHVQTAYRHACSQCGEEISMAYPYCPWCKTAQNESVYGPPRLTDAELIDELHRLYGKFGKVTVPIMNQHGRYGHSTYTSPQHFGTWNNAIEAAGLPKNNWKPSLDELREDYQRVADKLNRVPSRHDLDTEGEFSSQTYYNRLGSSDELAEQILNIPNVNS